MESHVHLQLLSESEGLFMADVEASHGTVYLIFLKGSQTYCAER